MGFMPARSAEDASLILESVIGKSIGFNMPLFFASLDLKKAFDRILWPQVFEALLEQGVERPYLKLLAAIYSDQTGKLGTGKTFQIGRGVRQGNVLSPLLFNAALEMVMRRWIPRLQDHGKRPTNVKNISDYKKNNMLLLFQGCEQLSTSLSARTHRCWYILD